MICRTLRAVLEVATEYRVIYKPNQFWGSQIYIERKDQS